MSHTSQSFRPDRIRTRSDTESMVSHGSLQFQMYEVVNHEDRHRDNFIVSAERVSRSSADVVSSTFHCICGPDVLMSGDAVIQRCTRVFAVHGASKSNNTQGDIIDERYPDRNPE